MNDIESLINDVKNRKYRYIKETLLDINTNKYLEKPLYRRITRADDEKVVSVSNLITNKLDIIRKYPVNKSDYKLINNGFIDKVDCGKYGIKYVEVVFLKELPWLKSVTKKS